MSPSGPQESVRRIADGVLGTFHRVDPDGRAVVRWDGDGITTTADPRDFTQFGGAGDPAALTAEQLNRGAAALTAWVEVDLDEHEAPALWQNHDAVRAVAAALWAPGAAVAAPPSDEGPVMRRLLDERADAARERDRIRRQRDDYRDMLVRLTTGGEDEAAVERAAEAHYEARHGRHGLHWRDLMPEARSDFRNDMRTALAAARGAHMPGSSTTDDKETGR